MGWKASLVIIENPDNFQDERLLLDHLGLTSYEYKEETTLEECIYPRDKSLNIGYYNGSIVIGEGLALTEKMKIDRPADYELKLSSLFPNCEILTVGCHSFSNAHMYSLVKNGKKLRYKHISALEEDDYYEFGNRLKEEEEIYDKAILKDGKPQWQDEDDPEYFYVEHQLMEDFTFKVAKRLLGVEISKGDNDKLLFETPFRKYVRVLTKKEAIIQKSESLFGRLWKKRIVRTAFRFLLFLSFYILYKYLFRNS